VLNTVTERMKDFFQRNPSVGAAGGDAAIASPSGVLDAAGRDQVRELTTLMAEAEVAWETARSLTGEGDEADGASEEGQDLGPASE
jgi:hypothetical protein